MTTKLLISVAMAAFMTACTTATSPGTSISSSVSPGVTSPSVAPRASVSIALPWLPPQGVVVERNGGVVFVGLDGRVVAKIHGLRLANPTEAPGAILFRRGGGRWFVLDVAGSALRPIERARADQLHEADGHASISRPRPG